MKNFNKNFLLLVIPILIVLFSHINVEAKYEGVGGYTYTINETNVYSSDTSSATIIARIKSNQSVYRILKGDNYDLIRFNNRLGFITKSSLSSKSYFNSGRSYTKLNNDGFTKTRLNMRLGPSIFSGRIKTLERGTSVKLLAISDNNWYLISHNNTLGFVAGNYITTSKTTNNQSTSSKSYKELKALTNVNIRKLPNVSSTKLDMIIAGSKVQMIEKVNGWYKVYRNGRYGYVNANYVQEVDTNSKISSTSNLQAKSISNKMVYMNSNTSIYSKPNGNIIGSLPKYETALVYGETGNYYLIKSDSLNGYIKKSNCKSLTGTYVVVDISSQTMTLYKNTSKVLSSSVVTGKDSTPSDIGIFKIYYKQKNRTLVGQDYSSFVKYWMAYNRGEGLHDASWRSKFGGTIYHQNGSHGCVNLPSSVAENLYNNVSVGTPVLVKK